MANYINAESWEHQLDLEANPNYLDPNFWKDTDFTMFVFCPFDVTLGGLTGGEGKMTFGDFYPGEQSADGRLWSFLSREGTRVYKKADPTKSSYFKGYIDRSTNIAEQGPIPEVWEVKNQNVWTCETGILPGHHPEAISKLFEHYPIFNGGSFAQLVNYLRSSAKKHSVEDLL